MAGTGAIFGRPGGTASIANAVMSSPSVNALPSPTDPADIVENPTLQGYYRLYNACNEIMPKERDRDRARRLLEIKSFADDTIRELEGQDASSGPPAAMPPGMAQAAGAPPPPQPPPPGASPAGGIPGAQPGALPPALSGGAPPSPIGAGA